MENIPPKVQNQLAMLQQMQQQLQTVVSQKAQYELTIREARRAVEDPADLPEDAAAVMNVGPPLIAKRKGQAIGKASGGGRA